MSEYSELSRYSRGSRMTFKVLLHLAARGAISPALTLPDRDFLERFEKVWLDKVILRAQLSRINRVDRLAFLETTACENRWERYVSTRLRKSLALGRTVKLAELVAEIRRRFGIEPTESRMRAIRRIRNRIYVERYRAGKAGKSGLRIVG